MTVNVYANRENLSKWLKWLNNIIILKGVSNIIFIDKDIYAHKTGIYQIRNTKNGKCYIGQTYYSFDRRFYLHQWKLREGTHDNTYLQNDFNAYGEDNFCFEVIVELPADSKDYNTLEQTYIKERRKTDCCYNIQDGGKSFRGCVYTPEMRKHVGELNRERLMGTKLPETTKENMSKSQKLRYKKLTSEHRSKSGKPLCDDETIKLIKQMIMQGISPMQVSKDLNVNYKFINGIYSCNTYSNVYVEGWEEFNKTRPRKKRGKYNKTILK